MIELEEIFSIKKIDDNIMKSILNLINENFDCSEKKIEEILTNSNNYFIIIKEKYNENVLSVIIYNIISSLSSIKYLDISNFIIKNNEAFPFVANYAISRIEEIAKMENCQIISIKLLTKNISYQRLFAENKFNLNHFIFEKILLK